MCIPPLCVEFLAISTPTSLPSNYQPAVVLMNRVMSGLCDSLGGGGLGGGLACRLSIGFSGKRISVFDRFTDSEGIFGDDMLACMLVRGS